MNRPKIKVALTGILLLFGAIFVLFSCFAVLSMRTLNNNFAQIAVNSLPEISTSKELKNNLLKLTMDYLNQIMALDRASRKAMEGVIVSDTQLFLTTLGRALESSDPVEQSWISKIKTTFSEMQAKAEPMFEMSRRGFQSEANRIAQSEIQPLADEIGGMLDSIGAQKIEKADAEHQHSEDVFKQTMKIALVSIAAAVVILIAGIFFAIVGIARPIERITRSMNGLVGGNIAAEIPFAGRCDEIGAMAKSVSVFRDHAIERLRLEKEASDSQDLVEREREQRLSDERQHAAHIQKAVQSLASALDKLAAGNLAHRIEEHFVGDLDCLRDNFNSSVDRLNNVLAEVGHNAHAIDAGATEIRTAAHSLAARTEQQASSLEETASSLREITQAVHESANWAVEAGSLIDKAREEAENSGEIITRAIGAMQEINRSADEISSIVGIIDSMAFQTNLLALNAGVEAARAGESGKGFAVVAQEVRELAQRSAHAARAIKTLIGSSDSQVKAGVALVNQTGEALQRILGEVKSINGQIQLMVSRTQDQAKRIETVSSAVSGLDRSTQQNAAMVEEQNGACRGLAGEASALNRLLQQFHLGTMGNEERRYRATA